MATNAIYCRVHFVRASGRSGLLIRPPTARLTSYTHAAAIDNLPALLPRIAVVRKPVSIVPQFTRFAHSFCRFKLKFAMVNPVTPSEEIESSTNRQEEMNGTENKSVLEGKWKEIKVPVPWGHLAVKVWGSPNDNPILALHGWQDNAGSFDQLIPLLPSNFYIVCLDFCGHGYSSHYPAGMIYHYWDHLAHVRFVAKYFGWNRFSILGHSLGGIVGSMFAAIAPEMVDKLVMIDIVKAISVPAKLQPEKTAKAIETCEQIMKKLLQTPPSYSHEVARDRLVQANGGSIDTQAAEVLMRRGTLKNPAGGIYFSRDLRHVIPSFGNYTLEQHLEFGKRIKCPLLLLKAKNGPMYEGKDIHDQFVQLYRDNNPAFEYVEVDGTHHVHLVQPENVASHIERFFTPSFQVDA